MYFALMCLGGSGMTYQEILSNALRLSDTERKRLICTLEQLESKSESPVPSLRLNQYLENRGRCPHCGGTHYYRFGKDKGAQRFMCRNCGRAFTQYTGTWMGFTRNPCRPLHEADDGAEVA